MNNVRLLGAIDFEISASAVPPTVLSSVMAFFVADPSALAVGEQIIRTLRSAQYAVTEPKREGKGSVWFRCEMERHDAGISVAISERRTNSVVVSTLICQMKKVGQKKIDPFVDPRWPEVSRVIKAAIEQHYGQQAGFAWHDEESYDSPRARE